MTVAALLGWTTFLAGGVYPWVWIPAFFVAVALAWSARPARITTQQESASFLDGALAAGALALVVQLIPLPGWLMSQIDPHAADVRAALWATTGRDAAAVLPISVRPRDTVAALGIFLMAAVLFHTSRRLFHRSGTGPIVRTIAVFGILAALAAIVQRAVSQEMLYGFWRPLDAGARPYGPFVNRNHFATWAIMACPLILGYLLARAPSRSLRRPWSQRVADAAKHLGSIRVWLVCSICLLTLAVVLSTSRSGLIGLIGGFAVSAVLSRHRYGISGKRWLALQLLLLALAVISFVRFDALLARLDETVAVSAVNRGRSAIWRDTAHVIGDFPLTGTGAGTFGVAVIPYQTAEPGYSIRQAHNHYLQILAEGGALIAFPVLLASVAFLLLFRRRLSEDTSPDFLIRAGAASGMAGALVQSLWETGLRMPANALLFSVLAAIAVHQPPRLDHR